MKQIIQRMGFLMLRPKTLDIQNNMTKYPLKTGEPSNGAKDEADWSDSVMSLFQVHQDISSRHNCGNYDCFYTGNG
jgi:hypothetical protein